MRTTVNLEPGLFIQLEEQAAQKGITVNQLANQMLQTAVSVHQNKPAEVYFKWRVAKGGKPADGFDPAHRDYLDDL